MTVGFDYEVDMNLFILLRDILKGIELHVGFSRA